MSEKLNLGCFSRILPGYVNLDRKAYFPGIDVAHDLEEFPYPFADNTFKEILASFVLEHINPSYTASVLAELHRISKPQAVIRIGVPYKDQWLRNIDHKRGFDYFTFFNLTKDTLARTWLNEPKFTLINLRGIPTRFGKLIPNIPIPFSPRFVIGKHVIFRFGLRDTLSLLLNFIVKDIYVELEVIKEFPVYEE